MKEKLNTPELSRNQRREMNKIIREMKYYFKDKSNEEDIYKVIKRATPDNPISKFEMWLTHYNYDAEFIEYVLMIIHRYYVRNEEIPIVLKLR